MMFDSKFIFMVLILFILIRIGAAETIYLKDGSKIEGKIVSMDSEQVVIETSLGKLTFKRADILKTVYADETQESITLPQIIEEPKKKNKPFFSIGPNFGLFNYHFENSPSYSTPLYGFQIAYGQQKGSWSWQIGISPGFTQNEYETGIIVLEEDAYWNYKVWLDISQEKQKSFPIEIDGKFALNINRKGEGSPMGDLFLGAGFAIEPISRHFKGMAFIETDYDEDVAQSIESDLSYAMTGFVLNAGFRVYLGKSIRIPITAGYLLVALGKDELVTFDVPKTYLYDTYYGYYYVYGVQYGVSKGRIPTWFVNIGIEMIFGIEKLKKEEEAQ